MAATPLTPELDGIDWYRDPLPGPAFAQALHGLRRSGPVAEVRALGTMPVYYIVGYSALAEAFRDGEQFPPGLAYQRISEPYIGQTFMSMDEDEHRIWRPPMTPAFRRQVVEAYAEERLTALAHELIDRFEEREEVELATRFTRLFSFAVICELLGLPRDHEAEFYDWSMQLMFGGMDLEASRRADALVSGAFSPLIAARRREPRDDVISRWAHTEVDGRNLEDGEILAHIRLFFTAGATTTSDALGNLVHALLSDRRAWEACVADRAVHADAVEELLRWNPPVAAQPRFARLSDDVELAGVPIPANAAVLFGIAAANRDPDAFPDPDRFDIERRPKELLTFGPGLRTCPGMHLARKNLRVALEVLAERLPGLALCDEDSSQPRGVLLRGPACLPVSLR